MSTGSTVTHTSCGFQVELPGRRTLRLREIQHRRIQMLQRETQFHMTELLQIKKQWQEILAAQALVEEPKHDDLSAFAVSSEDIRKMEQELRDGGFLPAEPALDVHEGVMSVEEATDRMHQNHMRIAGDDLDRDYDEALEGRRL